VSCSGAGTGVTIPTNAINTAAPGQLVNPAYMPEVGLNAKSMALPPLETAAGGINYGFTAAPNAASAASSLVSPGMTAVPPDGYAWQQGLTDLDALKQSALTPMPPQPLSGPMTLDPALVGKPLVGGPDMIQPGINNVTLGRADLVPNAYTVGDPTSTTRLPFNEQLNLAKNQSQLRSVS
jgi:hypothetical protein